VWRRINHADFNDDEFSTFELHDMICGHEMGGYRVPSVTRGEAVDETAIYDAVLNQGEIAMAKYPWLRNAWNFEFATMRDFLQGTARGSYSGDEWFQRMYKFRPGYEVDAFAPIAMYGSLETVRSAYYSQNTGLSETDPLECTTDFAPEDVAVAAYCQRLGARGVEDGTRSLKRDMALRQVLSPFKMHRDRYCSPNVDMTLEDVLAKPGHFVDDLYDSYADTASGRNGLIVPALYRGDEKYDERRKQISLMAWVYITSSSDPDVRPGMHQLLDLPVFSAKPCAQLPHVQCNEEIIRANPPPPPIPVVQAMANTVLDSLQPSNIIDNVIGGASEVLDGFLSLGRRAAELNDQDNFLNSGFAALENYEADNRGDNSHNNYVQGREMVASVRCSMDIASMKGESGLVCIPRPYVASESQGCYRGDLSLGAASDGFYSAAYWASQLNYPPPRPTPTSPTPPPPSPSPPAPPAPMEPPQVFEQSVLMARVRAFEEQACTSVYYLTTATRCDRLAVQLTTPVLYETTNPPSPPPATPFFASPLLPPPPPSPFSPPGYAIAPMRSSGLSTMRVPTVLNEPFLLDAGYYMTQTEYKNALIKMETAHPRARVRCTDWQSNAPLACVSGVNKDHCVSALRHCHSAQENARNPFLELELAGPPRARGNRIFGLVFELPAHAELRPLFFQSAEAEGGKGYEVQLYRADGSTVPCLEATVQTASKIDSDTVQHICTDGGASDDALYALSDVVRVRVTLLGEWRQIWLRNVQVAEVAVAAAKLPPRSPSPPPLPELPPSPPQAPTGRCAFHAHKFYHERTVVRHEPCGQTMEQCCTHAVDGHDDVGANAFELNDSGCCLVIHVRANAMLEPRAKTWDTSTDAAGTGVVL